MEVELEVVGRNLGDLRAARGLSLRGLAELTGYTSSYLSQIERGDSVPSLSGLAAMANALGVEMSSLFEQAAGPRLSVSRGSSPLELRTGQSGAGHRYSVLGAHGNQGAYTALIHHLPAGEPPFGIRHFGERFGLLLAGEVVLSFGAEQHRLSEGQWIHYGSHEEHMVAVTSPDTATILWVVSPAIF